MKIDISRLNKTNGGRDFSYNDRAEDAISNAVCYYYDLQSNGGTTGFNPGYDKLINRTKVEIKISTAAGVFIEIAKGDGTPAGIFTSEADVYLTVNPGFDKQVSCMKVRLWHKKLLEHWARGMLEKQPDKLKQYAKSNLGPGSAGFVLEFNAVEDLYILGFNYVLGNKQIVFNTHDILPPGQFALNSIGNFIK